MRKPRERNHADTAASAALRPRSLSRTLNSTAPVAAARPSRWPDEAHFGTLPWSETWLGALDAVATDAVIATASIATTPAARVVRNKRDARSFTLPPRWGCAPVAVRWTGGISLQQRMHRVKIHLGDHF